MQPLARLCVGSDCSIGRIAISPATASRGHRRWQTMHNRWWSEAQPAGNRYLTIIRRRRCRTNLSIKERPWRTYMHLLHRRETCWAYGNTPLQAVLRGYPRPIEKASHATNGMRCFCVASPGSSDLSDQPDLSWEIDYFTITFLPLTIYIPAGRDCRSSCIFTPSIL